MTDTDNNNQSQSNTNEPSQQESSPSQPIAQPSIPATPDLSLASNMSKGLEINTTIPVQADTKLESSITMGED